MSSGRQRILCPERPRRLPPQGFSGPAWRKPQESGLVAELEVRNYVFF